MDGYVIMLDKQTLIQIGIQLVNTILLCFMLSKVLYTPILNFLNARKEKIAGQIDSAQQRLEEAKALKAEYEQKINNIKIEADEIIDNAILNAKRNSQEILLTARQEANNIHKRTIKDIHREEEKARDEVKKQIIEVSSIISAKFIKANITDDEQYKLVEQTILDLEEVKCQGL